MLFLLRGFKVEQVATAPGVPEMVSVQSSTAALVVTWRDNANNETAFELQRRTGSGGSWTTVARPGENATTYTNTGLAVGIRYEYRVRASNAQGNSAWSNVMSGTVGAAPPPPPPPTGAARYAAPNGSAAGQGTLSSPWNLSTAVQNGRVNAGDTLYLRGGTYKTAGAGPVGLPIRLAGSAGNPVHIRPYPGERVTIDGGLQVVAPAQDLWIWDLEVIVSDPRVPLDDASTDDPKRTWGGINLDAGPRCKIINCIADGNCQGISFWKGATDSEIHGCIVYDNGWNYRDVNGNPNSTGYAIYSQNEVGWKTISDCLFLDTYAWSFHLYGEGAGVDNYIIEGNVVALPDRDDIALIGGMRPSRNIRVLSNWFYNSKTYIGYLFSQSNVNCEVRDNLSVDGLWRISPNWQTVVQSGNTVVADAAGSGTRVLLRPNKYDPKRANLAVINAARVATLNVDAGPFLKAGDSYRLMDARRFYGAPLKTGTYQGTLPVPMGGNEFGAFVLFKD